MESSRRKKEKEVETVERPQKGRKGNSKRKEGTNYRGRQIEYMPESKREGERGRRRDFF